ncbi:flavin-nucleotide-binding protein [Rhodococcus sp. 05-2255-3B1]|uniref:pyridoxamine 5'-phosphate oxidase family protein n=1 Tax=unclassified Rhodococcus (in: high G+C Gram-positive bacteria) TaxID=192944 RepID=UPI000B9A599F|nr:MULTISPECIES: pyridoxamine 5'-phosphate oxidase family protein [unclassified Rhodococcus (in: high G+C Gram-positive bacteria)]OZE10034.1 flavin-nucleotide-binding protein [Rhodococcus sp. 05-2255-3B1]OZE10815.1 flavin-nucleotide-binding protein [Rhodococcus sp. 05-2255-3C]OZE24476.1 flavin-nucleotide-binding protein [Rhodococcus sp. 05-2255-2A2]
MTVDDVPLSPTARTVVMRGSNRASLERATLLDVLRSARICHVGVIVAGLPRVVPTVFGVDPNGPDREGTLYLHGSVASRSMIDAPEQDICVTTTVVDGLVLARSAFHHSMNYRSAVVVGRPRRVEDADERIRALDAIVDQVVPGRSAHLRSHTRKELAATAVLALPMYEASVKSRTGGPVDDDRDIRQSDVWAGVIPVWEALGDTEPAEDLAEDIPVPDHVDAMGRNVFR